MDRFAQLLACYDAYVDTFRSPDGSLPDMMRLKRTHTAFVVDNARKIADGEGFDSGTRGIALDAALLHDTGRYEQLRRYNTFRDSDSVDHAVFSHDIVKEKGWLAAYSEDEREAVLAAVLFHNRRDVPAGLPPLALAALHTVRDADKLDIFRVLEDRVAHTDWRNDCTAFWNLPVTGTPDPRVVEAIRAGSPVDYQHIVSLADFVLIQVGWMISGLHFKTSRRLCAERGHLAFRRRFLAELTRGDPLAEHICDLAETALS